MLETVLEAIEPRDRQIGIFDQQEAVGPANRRNKDATLKSSSKDPILLTILITDIVDSTKRLAELGDRRWSELLDEHDEMVVEHVNEFGGRTVSSTGDGFINIFAGPTHAIQCASIIRKEASQLGMEIKAGIHTGECECRRSNIRGLAMHIAVRILGQALPGQILTSDTVKGITVGSELKFTHVGTPDLKGVPGEWPLFEVSC